VVDDEGKRIMNMKYSSLLLRLSAIFGLIGAAMGGHMAGSYDYAYKPVHAHVLVVGWLSIFSWAVYYRVFQPTSKVLSALHVYSAIIGVVGLTAGMALNILQVLPRAVNLIVYIGGGATLLLSFSLFCLLVFTQKTNN
jgi:hypothetical protein